MKPAVRYEFNEVLRWQGIREWNGEVNNMFLRCILSLHRSPSIMVNRKALIQSHLESKGFMMQ